MYSSTKSSSLSLIDEHNDAIFLDFIQRRITYEDLASAKFLVRATPEERINMLRLPFPMNRRFFDLAYYT
jgi:hypothetical protein